MSEARKLSNRPSAKQLLGTRVSMQRLMRSRKKPLYEALLKVKEELMLLGFISLLLTVFQGPMGKLCVSPGTMHHLLP